MYAKYYVRLMLKLGSKVWWFSVRCRFCFSAPGRVPGKGRWDWRGQEDFAMRVACEEKNGIAARGWGERNDGGLKG